MIKAVHKEGSAEDWAGLYPGHGHRTESSSGKTPLS